MSEAERIGIICTTHEWYGVTAQVYHTFGSHLYPWRFRIQNQETGNWIMFAGVPNYCETRQSAMARARNRCKWIADVTFNERYV